MPGAKKFVPPPVSSWEGPASPSAGGFTPPPVSADEGPSGFTPPPVSSDETTGDTEAPWYNAWQHPTQGFLGQGASHMVGGVKKMTEPGMPAKYTGATEVLRGATKMATPVAIGASLPTSLGAIPGIAAGWGAGVAGSYLGGVAGEELADQFNAGPEAKEFAGEFGSDIGGLYGGKRGYERFKQRPTLPPRPTNPIQPFLDIFKPQEYRGDEALQSAIPDMAETHRLQQAPGKSLVDPRTAYPGDPTKGVVDLAGKTEARLQNAYDALSDPRKRVGITISGDRIADSLIAAAEKARSAPGTAPDVSAGLMQEVNNWRGRQVPLAEAEAYLRKVNADIDAFSGRRPQAQRVALQGNAGDVGVLNAKAGALRDSIYEAVSPLDEGEGAADIKRRWGNVREARTMAEGMVPKARLQTPQPFLSKAFDLYKGTGGGTNKFGILQAIAAAAKPTATIDEGLWNAFNNFKGEAAPLAASPNPNVMGAIAPPADTSGALPRGVADFRSVGYPGQPQGPRLLPAATSQIGVSGTTVPDIIGRSRRGTGTGAQGQIAAPEPGRPATRVQPAGAAGVENAIGPGGTVPQFSTESPFQLPGVVGGSMTDLLRSLQELRNKYGVNVPGYRRGGIVGHLPPRIRY